MAIPIGSVAPKFYKYFFSLTILVYAFASYMVKTVTLEGKEGGLVLEANDPWVQNSLYIFIAVAFVLLVLSFIIPSRLNSSASAEIVRNVFAEGIAVCGLLYCFITGELYTGWIFMEVALITILLGMPRQPKAL